MKWLKAMATRADALQHAQDTVTGSGGGQVLEGVTSYAAPRRGGRTANFRFADHWGLN